jgi:hypothetical protein
MSLSVIIEVTVLDLIRPQHARLETFVSRRAHRMHNGVPSKAKSWPTRR